MRADEFAEYVAKVMFDADVDVSDLTMSRTAIKFHNKLKNVPNAKLCARIYTTLDVAGGGPIEQDLLTSCLSESLTPYWENLDTDKDGRLTVDEWNAFCAKMDKDEGPEGFRDWLVSTIYESDIDVSDLLTANTRAKLALLAKHSIPELQEIIFKTVDSNASGTVEKRELQYSVVKESLLPYWASIDTDADGCLTMVEFTQFCERMKTLKGGEWYDQWFADMVIYGDIAVDMHPRQGKENVINAQGAPLSSPTEALKVAKPPIVEKQTAGFCCGCIKRRS